MGDHLYCLDLTSWASFTPIPARQHKHTFSGTPRALAAEDIPTNLAKATIYSCGPIITVTGSGPINYSQQQKQQPLSTEFWTSWNCKYRIEGSAKN